MNMATMNKPSASNATLPWTARLDLQVVFFALLRNHHAPSIEIRAMHAGNIRGNVCYP
jgi:hypothetical protein